ncbi:NAD(P)H-binding protein [Hamadaea tsunoensis]|uniref:NAD(P)H-binding protein n=1 Tax=Hamadaea tsunoensis TaxID=53368 RepID=UPI0003F9FC7A|nr:NAD(P)H-binding protein [Hamadaea tsunoensis]
MIVVTAPTGNIGRRVAENLLEAHAQVRVVARDPARLTDRVRREADVVTGSHADPDVVAKAFAAAAAVFWLAPANYQAADALATYVDFSRPAVRALAENGVPRVVGISALGRGSGLEAGAGLVSASLAMDDLIAGSGVAYRALCMPSFMDNVLWQAESIRETGLYFSPVRPDRPAPIVATRDIADVATRFLLDSGWTGAAEQPVLGPEDLSNDDLAEIMSDVLGRPVRFQQTGLDAYRERLLAGGQSPSMAQAMIDMVRAKDEGLDNWVTRTPEATTPTTFRRFCEDRLRAA